MINPVLNDYQSMVAAQEISIAASDIRAAMLRPSVLYQPILRTWNDKTDGKYWLAKYWDVEGKGASPAEAMADFDKLWNEKLQTVKKEESVSADLPLFSEGETA